METLRIAFVADRVEPFYHGGYERHITSLSHQLARSHEVTVFTSASRGVTPPNDSVKLRVIGPPLEYTRRTGSHSLIQASAFALTGFASLPTLKHFDFVDILGIPYIQVPGFRLRAALGHWSWGITIWEAWQDYAFHGGLLGPPSKAAFRSIIRLSTLGEHPVIVGSVRTRDSLMEGYGVEPSRIFVIPPGLDFARVDSFRPSPFEFDCIYLGRLDPYKRVGDLLQAIAEIKKSGTELRVAIIGEGPEHDLLRDLTTSLGIARQVEFLGFVGEGRKYGLLKNSKLFVMPSEREGFSIATLEAIAAKACPIVARPKSTELFGAWDLIRCRADDVTYPVGDVKLLARRIQSLLGMPELRKKIVSELKVHANKFDIHVVADSYVHMIGAYRNMAQSR